MNLKPYPEKIKLLEQMLVLARSKKNKSPKHLIELHKQLTRTKIEFKALEFSLSRMGDWEKYPRSYLDLVRRAEISWPDEPKEVEEWRNLN